MARLSLLLLVVAVAVFAPNIPQCEASWTDLLAGAAKDILIDTGTIEILDYVCNYSVTPRFKRWELYFNGNVWCPGWTTIKGESETRSRSSVVNKAVADFARKAVAAGIMTEEDAQPLLHA